MKLLHLKYAFVLCICSVLFSCTKKEPADILVKKKGTWNYSEEHYYNETLTGTKNGEITFEANGVGIITTDTGDAAIKWDATNFTVTIEYYPKEYTYYAIKEESAKKIVLENKPIYSPFERQLTLSRK